ncbi:MAG: phenylalanine--tRNA ligase subunit alpha [Pseudomonadota bacterium]
MESLASLLSQAQSDVAAASDLSQLQSLKVQYFGKKGQITALLQQLGALTPELRKTQGQAIHAVQTHIQACMEEKHQQLQAEALDAQLRLEQIDITAPARQVISPGSLHPITLIRARLETYFTNLGFVLAEGPEVESEYHNFSALNHPPHHPARSDTDTFYLNDAYLLRTQTSPVQIRSMLQWAPPLRLVAIGKVFRRDSSVRHTPMFHQIEGLVIDEHINFSHLKGILYDFLTWFFNQSDVKLRFRPSFFPFTEPSAEVDIQCRQCAGKGCRVCSNSGWLEILGCGMVHPSVLEAGKVDTERYRGYAFGMGLERLAMLYLGIPDIRALYENDLSFHSQFPSQ